MFFPILMGAIIRYNLKFFCRTVANTYFCKEIKNKLLNCLILSILIDDKKLDIYY